MLLEEIQLQNEILISISIYNNNGLDSLVVSSGSPGAWNQLFTDELQSYQVWNNHSTSFSTP